MAQVQFDVPYSETRNRGTVAIRLILAIPHMIIVAVWAYAVEVVAVVQWFIQVFTGKRNKGLSDFTVNWLNEAARVYGYLGLLFDEYPEFVNDEGKTPVRFSMPVEEEPVNRLTVGLRIIWAIPALVIAWAIGIAIFVVTLLGWFAILVTGKLPPGWHSFLVKAHKYVLQEYAYLYLVTDEYPKY
ncbi:MAG: hypothetical protein JWM12_1231 [Ilumatobacteraceae bacterium]|jgi:hypothetical protein|nr:hypothetical protein [Ilumatobacteraceae bacterium]